MINIKKFTALAAAASMAMSINLNAEQAPKDFNYNVDNFADIQILRYYVPGFDQLDLNKKLLIYYLNEAALAGRDIIWDQKCEMNLPVRALAEAVYENYDGDVNTPDYQAFVKYLKQLYMGTGMHHHYSTDKFKPEFSRQWLEAQAAKNGLNAAAAIEAIFNPDLYAKGVNQAEGQDLIVTSATNLYGPGLTQQMVEDYYAAIKDPNDATPISYGLNTRKALGSDGKVVEQTYRVGGLYSPAIEKIIDNLSHAAEYAENAEQKAIINSLIDYYRTGDLKKFDEYSILWTEDTASQVDFVNGFIESYGDPLGMTGHWESIVNFKNEEASHRTEVLSSNAQWFEDRSPINPIYRKPEVKGVSAKVITATMLAGDSYPSTPIGINLPNANWIRAAHGSKSVTLENITQAYDEASHGDGFNQEFVIDEPTRQLMEKYLFITDNLHTDLHECLGHGSGRLAPGVDPDALRAHGSTLEETRADLFALYYLADPKLIELGLLDDPDAYKAEYYKYMLNGLMTQLMRIEPGKDVEEAHMRNRQLIARWCLEKGAPQGIVEMVKRDGKTYVQINDYEGLRRLFGELLYEVQRVRSEGDYQAGRDLVENYAVKVDPELHREVLERYATLHIAPYRGFVNPVYTLVVDEQGQPVDVTVDYTEGYLPQNLRYSKQYRTLGL